jgi:hypothetical protein
MLDNEISYKCADIEASLLDVASSGRTVSLETDLYRESTNATRGLPMAMNNDSFWLASQPGFLVGEDPFVLSGGGFECSLPAAFLPPFGGISTISGSVITEAESKHFQEYHIPPKPPSSEHFTFAPTTLFLEGCMPQQIGKRVVDFFTSQVVASVTKIRPQKYSIKAEVFVEAVSCILKVKVFQYNEGKYAVEVQRRSGDAFVVQSTYHLLVDFLELHCAGVRGTQTSAPLAQPTVPKLEPADKDAEVPSVEVLAPLLTMARVTGLQSEAASALVAVVKGGDASGALFSAPDEVASALMDLLESGCMDTVYPAAHCVSVLAAFGEADSILARHGLLQNMALQAVAELKTAQGLVGTALAQAVVDAMHCCAGSLTTAAARELQQILDDAMNDKMLSANVVARTHLEQAELNARLLVA